jgi:hypothetical protein
MTDRTVSKNLCILLEGDQELTADVHKHILSLENEPVHKVLPDGCQASCGPAHVLCLSVQLVTAV